MSEQLFNQFADIPALEKQLEQINKIFSDVKAGIGDLSKVGIKIEGATGIKELNAATKEYDRILSDVIARKAQYNGSTKEITELTLKQAKAEKELAKAALDRARAGDVIERSNAKQVKDAALLTNDYAQLSKAYNEAALKAKNYALQLGETNPVTVEAIKNAKGMYDILLRVDQAVGQNQRNVGNYKSAFDGLSFSFTQVARELPSLAISPQQFFLAISNNLPMVTDEIAKAKAEIKALQAEGKAAPSLFSRLSSSILSFNVFLSVGITLLTVYGKEIANWAKGLFSGKDALENLSQKNKLLSETFQEGAKAAAGQVAQVTLLRDKLNNLNLSQTDRIKFAKQYNEVADKANQIDLTQIDNLSVINSQISAQIALIQKRAIAKAAENKLSETAENLILKELELRKALSENSLTDADVKNAIDADSKLRGSILKTQRTTLDGFNQIQKTPGIADKMQSDNDRLSILANSIPQKVKLLYQSVAAARNNLSRDTQTLSPLIDVDSFSSVSRQTAGGRNSVRAKEQKDKTDYEFEIYKLHQQRLINTFDDISEKENYYYEIRLAALGRFIEESIALRERQFISESSGKTGKELVFLEEKKYSDILDIVIDGEKRIQEINKDKEEGQKILYGNTYKIAKQAAEDLAKLEKERREKYLKDEAEFNKKKKDLYKTLYKEIQDTIFAFIDASYQREDDALARKLTLLDREAEAKKNAINASGLNEVERTKQLAAVEKQAAFDRERIEEKRRQIAIQRARFDKAQSIANIVLSTTQAVIGALKPDGVTTLPQRVLLAALIGTIGAAQLAKAVATPIPQYFKGTESAKQGLSLVGEIGTELMEKDGKFSLTPSVPTLVNLAGGEKIYPADVTKDILNAVNMRHLIGLKHFSDIPMSEKRINQRLQEKMLTELREINSKSRIIINNQMGIESSAYYQNNMKN
jgi:hypothetical protein